MKVYTGTIRTAVKHGLIQSQSREILELWWFFEGGIGIVLELENLLRDIVQIGIAGSVIEFVQSLFVDGVLQVVLEVFDRLGLLDRLCPPVNSSASDIWGPDHSPLRPEARELPNP